MKLRLFCLFAFVSLASSPAFSQATESYTVMCYAEVVKSPAKITIYFKKDALATSYQVFRKTKDETGWGTALKTLSATDSMYADTAVQAGKAYEYRIRKSSSAGTVYGYIYAGIELPVIEDRGRLLLIIDTSALQPTLPELDKTRKDLVGDGWKYNEIWVGRNDSVIKIKEQILYYQNMLNDIKAVYLLGRVPVPYAGDFGQSVGSPPDGHPDHVGAWPADVYYGELDGFWSDEVANNTAGSRAQNKNIPFDTKFDQTFIDGDAELQVGRVDLSDMPAFGKTEQQLLVQYLQKATSFKNRQFIPAERTLVDDNFGGFNGEAFASTGMGSFSSMVYPGKVEAGKLFQRMDTGTYLFAYGCGGGTYTSASGVGNTDSFAMNTVNAPFFSLFGSYFGDWDATNSFLRAPLASMPMGLTSAWSGRPYWHFHHMSLGDNIGYSARLSQNNISVYSTNFFAHYIHISLMGDPTLRLHYVNPVSNVVATGTSGNTKVNISWTASSDNNIIGYYVYRSHGLRGTFVRVNSTPVTGTSLTDDNPFQGNNIYMVRAVKMQHTASGSYHNMSIGQFAEVSGITGKTNNVAEAAQAALSLYPNPSNGHFAVYFGNKNSLPSTVQVFDMTGKTIYTISTSQELVDIDGSGWPAGLYLVQVKQADRHYAEKIIIR